MRLHRLALLLPALAAANPTLRAIPPDTWYRAPGTAMTAVCPDKAKFPAIQGTGGCAMVTAAWGGGALDPAGKRLLVWGGGHNDYYGNEVYAFDLEALRWSLLTQPSPAPTLGRDPMGDGKPLARHTYDGLAWLGHAGRFFAYGGSYVSGGKEATWTLADGLWTSRNPTGAQPSANCCNFSGAYDPGTKKVFFRDPNGLYAYAYEQNTWTRLMDWSHSWGAGKSVVDTARKILFTAGSGEFLAYDIATNKDVTAAWKTTGGTDYLQKAGAGLAYDPHGDRLVGWAGGAPWVLELKSKAWSRGTATGAPASPEANGTYGRWQYLPWEGVFALVNRAGEDVYFYRPAGSLPPQDTVTPPGGNPPGDTVTPPPPPTSLAAFPGAEGWGAATPGGRRPGTKVYVVTTLASSGPGSFAEAILAKGPRIITFRVSGVIALNADAQAYLSADHSYVTVAGQTSPGGVTLTSARGGSSILMAYNADFSHGVFRFLRFRGTATNGDAATWNKVNNLIFDHCDFSGGGDETLEFTRAHRITLQWCTVANSGRDPADPQMYGLLLAYPPTSQISLHHNLIANHQQRFPEMHWRGGMPIDGGQIDFRNNVLYNGGRYFLFHDDANDDADGKLIGAAGIKMNLVGNTLKAGPQSPPNAENEAAWFFNLVSLGQHITGYESDNVMIPRTGALNRTRVGERTPNRVTTPWAVPAVTTQAADAAYDLVLGRAGAFPRDPMAMRTVAEVRTGAGQFGKTDDALVTSGPAAPADADLDGMADEWELSRGLSPANAADAVQDRDGDGYLNIEEYVNLLAVARLEDALPPPVISPPDTVPPVVTPPRDTVQPLGRRFVLALDSLVLKFRVLGLDTLGK